MNKSQLAWALPRLERYIQWDEDNRDVDKNKLLNWHQGSASRRRDCHFTDIPSPSILKHLLKGEGGAAE